MTRATQAPAVHAAGATPGHVVMFSGGITSWAAARRVAEQHPGEQITLLFADTLVEDTDLYRFADDAARQLGMPLVRIADGRTPWQVFRDERFLGNSRIAPCSKLLKQATCRRWLREHTYPDATTLYVGIDWTEMHRLPAIVRGWRPWTVRAPLCDPPWRTKDYWISEARSLGLEPPRLYALGFAHNNCGGACVRGGQAQWAHLLRTFPDRYLEAERREQELREQLGADVSILRERIGGQVRPLTLTEFRQRLDTGQAALFDLDDWGGCGCLPAPDADRSEAA